MERNSLIMKVKPVLSVIVISMALSFHVKPLGVEVGLAKPGQIQADNRTLKERAKGAHNYQERKDPDKTKSVSTLKELAKRSTNIIIGVPKDNVSKLTLDGNSIVIEYLVRVEHTYKGSLKEGQTIKVVIPGGRLTFGDGGTAEVKTPWFRKMLTGKAYALFLGTANGNRQFETTGEAQGIFEIPTTKESRAVKVHTGVPGDPMWRYQNIGVMKFLREIRSVANQ